MPDYKTLLGEHYTAELETALTESLAADYIPRATLDTDYIPKSNAAGEAKRLKGERDALDKQLKDLQTASLSADEKRQAEINTALEAARNAEVQHLSALSRLTIKQNLADIDDATLELLAGANPETADKLGKGIAKMLKAAYTAGEAAANKQQLDANTVPKGGTPVSDGAVVQQKYNEAVASGSMTQIAYWTRVLSETNNRRN